MDLPIDPARIASGPQAAGTPGAAPAPASGPPIVADLAGVGVVRDGRWILSGIDWTVRRGERWVVLGPNGSGKTTLLEVLSTYLYPSTGTVTILGERHGHTDVRLLRRRIGYASAHLARMLDDRLTALEAVMTARTAALHPWWDRFESADARRARSLLRSVGSEQFADHTMGTLSEGERQRVQIARALMNEPELLLLDEVSAGLDLGARERLVRRLADLAAHDAVPAILFVTHHVEEIPRHFTHALLLREGRPFARGPIEQTLTSDALSGCFGLSLHLERRAGRFAALDAEPGSAPGTEPGRAATAGRRARTETIAGSSGRAKAYRPMAAARRLAALEAGVAAFRTGEFFEAHELLEPAWMGARDPVERDLYQGLIKLAAAGVHAWRRNPAGVQKNMEGARRLLAGTAAATAGAATAPASRVLARARTMVKPEAVLAWIDAAIARPSGPPGPEEFGAALGSASFAMRRAGPPGGPIPG